MIRNCFYYILMFLHIALITAKMTPLALQKPCGLQAGLERYSTLVDIRRIHSSVQPLVTVDFYDPKKDLAALKDLFKSNIDQLVSIIGGTASMEYKIARLLEEVESPMNKTIVLKRNQELIGFIIYTRDYWVANAAHILVLCIKSQWRSNNYGEKLLRFVINELKSQDIHKISLGTSVANKRAQNLYQKVGFSGHPHPDSSKHIEYELEI